MQPETIQQIFTYFDEKGFEITGIKLFGGEPLLLENEQTIREIIQIANDRKLSIWIITNGYTLVDYLPLLMTAKIEKIQITVDGDLERHNATRYTVDKKGTFDNILQGIVMAQQHGLPLSLRCNIDMDENDQVQRLLDALTEYNLSDTPNVKLYISPIAGKRRQNCGDTFWEQYLDKIDQYTDQPLMREILASVDHVAMSFLGATEWSPRYVCCKAHLGQMVFDPWGWIYPCPTIVCEEEKAIGRYDKSGIYFNETYSLWRGRTIQADPTYRECAMALFCGGGCAVNATIVDSRYGYTGCDRIESLCNVFFPYLYKKYLK